MRTIGHEKLKQKLDRKDHFRLVMALGEWAYQAKHIPGSIHFATMREMLTPWRSACARTSGNALFSAPPGRGI